jgi:hypothetical protein
MDADNRTGLLTEEAAAGDNVSNVSPVLSSDDNAPNISPGLCEKREELTDLLRSRLIECGWRDQVASMCRDLIQKRGVEQVKLSDIISEVRPEARQKIPANIRTELLDMIRQINQGTSS